MWAAVFSGCIAPYYAYYKKSKGKRHICISCQTQIWPLSRLEHGRTSIVRWQDGQNGKAVYGINRRHTQYMKNFLRQMLDASLKHLSLTSTYSRSNCPSVAVWRHGSVFRKQAELGSFPLSAKQEIRLVNEAVESKLEATCLPSKLKNLKYRALKPLAPILRRIHPVLQLYCFRNICPLTY